jgi:hypothetical protein
MRIENLIFLGAGASHSEGASIQANLLNDFFITHDDITDIKEKEIKKSIQNLLKDFFGFEFRLNEQVDKKLPTLEEVLGILDLAIQKNECFRNYENVSKIREDLISLIALTIKEKLNLFPNHHNILLKRLKRENELLKSSFISLNYDIIIDNRLTELYPEYHLDYGIDFINYEEAEKAKKNGTYNDRDYWVRPNSEQAIKLFKLHGSLNWLYCPVCLNMKLTPKKKSGSSIMIMPQKCEICSGSLTYIIIPPTFFKIMSNHYLRQVWFDAEKSLRNIKKIYFCGYSFPDADIHIKYLLKRIELSLQNDLEIFIINWHKKKNRCNALWEKNRYFRFFKEKDKIHYLKLSFQDFCERGIENAEDF